METMPQSTRRRIQRALLVCYFVASTFFPAFADEPATTNANPENNIINKRVDEERRWRRQGIILIPHHFNYLLPYTYNTSPNDNPHDTDLPHLDNSEAKYQLSLKVLVWENVFLHRAHLYFGYTQLAMWQFYNNAASAPFRDTNYEPEMILTLDMNSTWFGWNLGRIDFAANHQSNGRSEPLSRSWNRAVATAYFTKGAFGLTVRPWFRIPEKRSQDDNPDIEHYMGHGEVTLAYSYRRQLLSMMFRDNFSVTNNKGAFQADYTFPLTRVLRGLVQYFYGYGECLLDYNHKSNRIGVGLALSEWK
jgi:phospholipase A1